MKQMCGKVWMISEMFHYAEDTRAGMAIRRQSKRLAHRAIRRQTIDQDGVTPRVTTRSRYLPIRDTVIVASA